MAALRKRARPVLTITDSASGEERGIIHFTFVDNRVRFYVDDASAAASGLNIDPRLLNVALGVRRRPA
ncbi:MAG TPA: YfiR family protein [Verrucomicrobiae bacterium]|nr:YfiR family protein [Verrucomicrobiae bacterium]